MVLLTSERGAQTVTHGEETFAPLDGTDAVFELPAELAEHLLALEGWRRPEADELPDVDDVDDQADDDEQVDEAPETPAPAPKRRRAPRKTTPAS